MTALAPMRARVGDAPSGMAALAAATAYLRVTDDPPDRDEFIDAVALTDPQSGPLADLLDRFAGAGFGANRRAAAASLMLRYGWAAGPIASAHLVLGQAMTIHDFALRFSTSTLVEGIWIRRASFAAQPSAAATRQAVRGALMAFSEALVESQHRWSGYSRHALWSMLTSSWAAQYTAIGERIGCRDTAVQETRLMLADEPQLNRAMPEIYEVRFGERSKICQRRKACCLFYKGPQRHFCASCPILPGAERLKRNQEWVCQTQ